MLKIRCETCQDKETMYFCIMSRNACYQNRVEIPEDRLSVLARLRTRTRAHVPLVAAVTAEGGHRAGGGGRPLLQLHPKCCRVLSLIEPLRRARRGR